MNEVKIFGAKTLERYTRGILIKGFQNNSWKVIEADIDEKLDSNGVNNILFQLHGAPQSETDDRKIMKLIKEAISQENPLKIIILIHRPDEIQKYYKLKEILSGLSKETGLVFLGNMHVNDSFYPTNNIKKRVIPHGFFPMNEKPQLDPIIIGSNTTWGEMRSLEHALKLLGEVFKLLKENSNVLGYIDGKPKEQLIIEELRKEYKNIIEEYSLELVDIRDYDITKRCEPRKNIVLINPREEELNFGVTYNLQMYYLGNKIRTGESSGTLHISAGIPVILEMNGAEVIENLKVIKVPYTDINNIKSIDFTKGAKRIVDSIKDDSYKSILKYNSKQSKFFDNTYVGNEYIKLFNELK